MLSLGGMKLWKVFCLLTMIFCLLIWVHAIATSLRIHGDDREHNDYILLSLHRRTNEERQLASLDGCFIRDSTNDSKLYLHSGSNLTHSNTKTGCTFWKKLHLFMHNDVLVYPSGPSGQKFKVKTDLQSSTRFLLARNPYSRLWSAYLDQFVLPDFWRTYGKTITSKRANLSEEAATCHNDVSFKEFLDYALSLSPQVMDKRWQPVMYGCDPCAFQPGVVGKIDTLTKDVGYILKETKLDGVLLTFNYSSFVEEEFGILIDYNFDLLNETFYGKCIGKKGLAILLWRVFQMYGYLPEKLWAEAVVMSAPKEFDKEVFKQVVLDQFHSATEQDRQLWKLQKAEYLREAYSTIPKVTLRSIIKLYKTDFKIFGYDIVPPGFEHINL